MGRTWAEKEETLPGLIMSRRKQHAVGLEESETPEILWSDKATLLHFLYTKG